MCASDTGLETQSQKDDDAEQSTEVDNIRPISNRNVLVRDSFTLTFGAEYVLKENIVRKNNILLVLPVK